MEKVVFVNHLPLGSASSYRQAGLAKYLGRLGYHPDLVGRAGKASVRSEGGSAGPGSAFPFDRTFLWREPIGGRPLQNALLAASATKGAAIVHVNRASPYTATLLGFGLVPRDYALVVDMEDWDGYGGYSSYARKRGPRGWLLTAYERSFPRAADAVLVVSERLRSYMLSIGVEEEKIFNIPNGFDEEFFHPDIDPTAVRKQYGFGNSPTVMYSSALWSFERRQHEVALEAFKKARSEVPGAKLLLTGAGDFDVKKVVRDMGLEDSVVLTGFVPRSQMPELMAAADVALHVISYHPFHQASSPMIISEYMAMGKPIVAPRSGEIATMLSDGVGMLVDGLDPSAMGAALARLLGDASLRARLGQRAIIRSRERYSYRVAAAHLREAYAEACSARSPPRRVGP